MSWTGGTDFLLPYLLPVLYLYDVVYSVTYFSLVQVKFLYHIKSLQAPSVASPWTDMLIVSPRTMNSSLSTLCYLLVVYWSFMSPPLLLLVWWQNILPSELITSYQLFCMTKCHKWLQLWWITGSQRWCSLLKQWIWPLGVHIPHF